MADWVRKLGAAGYQEREEATRRLESLTVDAPPPELLAATESNNPEVARRAMRAVLAIRGRAADRQLGRGRDAAARGAVDLFVASTSAWDLPADDARLWQPVLDLGRGIATRAKFGWPRALDQAWAARDKLIFIRSNAPHDRAPGEVRGMSVVVRREAVIAPEVRARGEIAASVIVSRGSVAVEKEVVGSVIIANGDVTFKRGVRGSLIVVDGTVSGTAGIHESLVITRGDIRVDHVLASTLIAGGKIVIPDPTNRDPVPALSRFQEGVARPLDYVSFFELSKVGLRAEEADGGVRVTKVEEESTMGKAGLAAGDLVTAVDPHPVVTPEDLRRRLRDAAATTGTAALAVRRGDVTKTLTLTFPDP